MNHLLDGIVRSKLIARGRRLLADRTGVRPSFDSPRRSDRFDDLTPAEVAALGPADFALLAQVRRTLADIASSLHGMCRRCCDPIDPEQLLEAPEVSWCSHCARPTDN